MKFAWDPEKEEINKRKHKVKFSDKYQLTSFDVKHSESEDRWITLGQTPNNKILVVIHTFKKEEDKEYVRIISARKATKSEIKQYLERKGK